MLVSAVRAEKEEIDGEEDGEEETDSLASSMISRQSIQDANMTLKPGGMTFPMVSKRDKRRIKDGEVRDGYPCLKCIRAFNLD